MKFSASSLAYWLMALSAAHVPGSRLLTALPGIVIGDYTGPSDRPAVTFSNQRRQGVIECQLRRERHMRRRGASG
jgi:hypothetical protein